ncbi:MAG: hypothetical protein DMF04_00090 [Verrucomicrobia bacterium]|nr:MAG: hypothetical protein DMF04_00090 [Verrucomicrobiota bacterium]
MSKTSETFLVPTDSSTSLAMTNADRIFTAEKRQSKSGTGAYRFRFSLSQSGLDDELHDGCTWPAGPVERDPQLPV